VTTPTSAARLVLRGARWPGDVAVRDGWITAVGAVAPEPGDRELRVDGDILTAGLVNTHHHLCQWMTRGRAVDEDLFGWLSTLYPVWGRLDAGDVHAAATVGLAELALSGCTTAADHHYLVPRGDDSVFDRIAAAASAVGIRVHISRGSMDLGESAGGLPPDSVVEDTDAILASTVDVHARLHDGVRTSVVVAPCSPFSVTRELMTQSAALARRLGVRLHTHLAETLQEEHDALARFGMRPVALMQEWGWVEDDVWVAHGVHLDDAEVALFGARRIGVAHCPSSNARPISTQQARRWAWGWTGWPVTRSAGCSRNCARRCTRGGCGPGGRRRSGSRPCCGWPPRVGPVAWAAPTSGNWRRVTAPTSRSGQAMTWPTWLTRWPGW